MRLDYSLFGMVLAATTPAARCWQYHDFAVSASSARRTIVGPNAPWVAKATRRTNRASVYYPRHVCGLASDMAR